MKGRKLLLRETITLTSGAIMFILGVSALVYVGNDLIVTKFNPDTWGTVSDWVIVLITLITAVLLILTLDSQKQVQEDQRKLTEIEINRFRDEFAPRLSTTSHGLIEKSEDKYYLNTTIFNSKNKSKDIVFYSNFELNIKIENRNDYNVQSTTNTYKKINKVYEYKITDIVLWENARIILTLKFNNKEFIILQNEEILIYYKDVKGYNYKTLLKINHNHIDLEEFDRKNLQLRIDEPQYL